jgi:hypothetical protein
MLLQLELSDSCTRLRTHVTRVTVWGQFQKGHSRAPGSNESRVEKTAPVSAPHPSWSRCRFQHPGGQKDGLKVLMRLPLPTG